MINRWHIAWIGTLAGLAGVFVAVLTDGQYIGAVVAVAVVAILTQVMESLKQLGWPHTVVLSKKDGDPYLTRRFLVGGPKRGRFALMLHTMHRPDEDRCPHDHPWGFVSLVLWGGYEEEIVTYKDLKGVSPYPGVKQYTRVKWNRPGTLLFRKATHTHRVSRLPRGNCVTLVLRGRKVRSWGFWNRVGQWTHWETFVNWADSVLWCGGDEYDPQDALAYKPEAAGRSATPSTDVGQRWIKEEAK